MSPIGPGITVLEVSDGTGNTHTVTTVAVEALARWTDPVVGPAVRLLHDVPARRIGSVTGREAGFRIRARDGSVEAGLDDLSDAYFGALPRIMDAPAASGT